MKNNNFTDFSDIIIKMKLNKSKKREKVIGDSDDLKLIEKLDINEKKKKIIIKYPKK